MNSPFPRRFRESAAAFYRVRVARHGAGGLTLMLGLVAVAIGGLVFLTVAESPWERGIPEKLRGEKGLTIRDTIVAGFWLGTAINVALAVLLLLLSRWWARPLAGRPVDEIAGGSRRFWAGVLLAVIVAGVIRAPRLTHSFWNDEEQAFRKFTWGEHGPAKDGGEALVFKPAGWDRALFYSVNGNNHVMHTVAAKLCHEAWRAIARPEPESFREWVIRLEPFVSGLLALVVAAVWLRRAGFPVAGVVTAWVLALHPWVLRYAVEARGYSAMLLFILLAFHCAAEALRTGRWRWWIGYGLSQCAYLLCFAGAVYLAVAMNALLALSLAVRRDPASLWRWFVACALGAMIFLQMMTATVLRIWNWIQAPHVEPFPMDASYARDFWAHLCLGVPWTAPEAGKHLGISLEEVTAASPLSGYAILFFLVPMLLAGIAVAATRSKTMRFALGSFALAAGLILLHNSVADLAFYGWYALYLVLGFAISLGFATSWLAERTDGEAARRTPRYTKAIGVVFIFAYIAWRPIFTICAHDRHPMRQAVIAARGEAPAIEARHAGQLSASTGSGANQILSYDPRAVWIKTAADLDAVIAEARKTGQALVVYACGPSRLRRDHPEIAQKLDDAALFEPGAYLPGLEEFWSFQIYRLRPAR